MYDTILSRAIFEIMAYLRLYQYSERSIRQYRNCLEKIEDYFYSRDLLHYDFSVMEDFRTKIKALKSGGQIGKTLYGDLLRTSHYVDNFYRGEMLTLIPCEEDDEPEGPTSVTEDEYKGQNGHLIEGFIDSSGYSPKRKILVTGYISSFMNFVEKEGWTPANMITIDMLARFMILNGKDFGRLRKMIGFIRSFMEYMRRLGMAEEIPSSFIYMKNNGTKPVLPCFTYEDLEKLIDAIDRDTAEGLRDYAVVMLALYTGIRGVDICKMNLEDIDHQRHTLRFLQRKTQAFIEIPMLPELEQALMEYVTRARPESRLTNLFLSKSGRPFREMNTHLHSLLDKAGLEHGKMAGHSFHSFRRCLALWMIETGSSPDIISMILGHRDPESFRRYIPLSVKAMSICAMPLTSIECSKEMKV